MTEEPTVAARLLGLGLRQPDRRSCGASALVAARMLTDPSYADRIAVDPGPRFRDAVLSLHRGVTRLRDPDGRLQPPWPRAIGTPPWALARGLAAAGGEPRVRHRTRLAVTDPASGHDHAHAAVAAGHPVALYVGSRSLPRHVVLAFEVAREPAGEALRVYEPSTGRLLTISREAAGRRRLGLAGWDVLWFVVGPTTRPARRTPA